MAITPNSTQGSESSQATPTSHQLLKELHKYPTPSQYIVALSGGMDSCVLLHALAAISSKLECTIQVIHVNHGLQSEAQQWADFCADTCQSLNLPFKTLNLSLPIPPGESLEAVARKARYAALASEMTADAMLLTGQHADDQVETFLLQLLRGAGVRGLAAMPAIKDWKQGWMARPLLHYSRQDLLNYAKVHNLHWMEDPSNQDDKFGRNYLRKNVIPLLKNRWPGLLTTTARSARHAATAEQLCVEMAMLDYAQCQGDNSFRLSIPTLNQLTDLRQDNLLRFWIAHNNLPTPNSHKIRRIRQEVMASREDAIPEVVWAGAEVRRYADALYLMPNLEPMPTGFLEVWKGEGDFVLPLDLGELHISSSELFSGDFLQQNRVQIGFRQENLKCTPANRQGSRSFKRLAQDYQITPWLRERVPLLFVDGQLAAVADSCNCRPFSKDDFILSWKKPEWLS